MPTAYQRRRAQNAQLIEVFRSTNLITPDQARIYARNQRRSIDDPLRIRAIRVAYLKTLESRFNRIEKLIRQSFRGAAFNVLAGAGAGKPLPKGSLGGPADLAIAAFEAWLRDTTADVILDGTGAEVVVPGRQFQRKLTERAFMQGLKAATSAAAAAGFVTTDPAQLFGIPKSTEAVELLANRQYQLLIGYTQDMADKQRAILIDAIAAGRTPDETAELLVKEVGIARGRAQRMARTEMTLAHSEANLNAFEVMGQTSVEFEFTLNVTGSAPPCPQCLDMAGRRFSITEAHGVIPLHPACQCGWVSIATTQQLRRAA